MLARAGGTRTLPLRAHILAAEPTLRSGTRASALSGAFPPLRALPLPGARTRFLIALLRMANNAHYDDAQLPRNVRTAHARTRTYRCAGRARRAAYSRVEVVHSVQFVVCLGFIAGRVGDQSGS